MMQMIKMVTTSNTEAPAAAPIVNPKFSADTSSVGTAEVLKKIVLTLLLCTLRV